MTKRKNLKPKGFRSLAEKVGSRIRGENQDEHQGTLSNPPRPVIGTVYQARVDFEDNQEWKPVIGTTYTDIEIGIVVPVEGDPDAIEVRIAGTRGKENPRRLLIRGLKLLNPDPA